MTDDTNPTDTPDPVEPDANGDEESGAGYGNNAGPQGSEDAPGEAEPTSGAGQR